MTDPNTIPEDTPTHRLHMMQMSIERIRELIERLQKRRATQVEKIKKAKTNSNVARAITVDRQFARIVSKLETALESVESDLDRAADDLNRARALFFEASNGELILEKEKENGNEEVEHC